MAHLFFTPIESGLLNDFDDEDDTQVCSAVEGPSGCGQEDGEDEEEDE